MYNLESLSLNFLPDWTILGNTSQSWFLALISGIIVFAISQFIRFVLLNRARAMAKLSSTDFDDTLIDIFAGIRPQFYAFASLFVASKPLNLPDYLDYSLNSLMIVWAILVSIRLAALLIDYGVRHYLQEDDAATDSAISALQLMTKIGLYALGGLLILSNLGIEVTSLIAGLGIGGVAVAFAVKDILGDLFSSFTIYLDKPFSVGDFVVVGQQNGTVKNIGVKTTRIKSLSGEEIVIPNQQLTNEVIHNFAQLDRRRVEFNFGLVYQTKAKQVEAVPEMVREIIESVDPVEFGRAHFKTFGDSALIFEVVFYVTESSYETYMNARQEIMLKIMKRFEQKGLEFAYPTQTIHLEKS